MPNGEIGVAQGFFVKGGSLQLDVYLKKDMRSTGTSGQFFRTSGPASRIWLNAIGEYDGFSQLAVVFRNDAALGEDPAFDAPRMHTGSPLVFSTLLGQDAFAIQAIPHTELQQTGSLPCLLHLNNSQLVTFKLDSVEALPSGVELWLEDRDKGRFFNLMRDSVKLRLTAGTYNQRFYLHWIPQISTRIDEPKTEITTVYAQAGQLHIKQALPGTEIEVFAANGQLLHSVKLTESSYSWWLPQHGIYLVRWRHASGAGQKKVAG